MRLYPVVEAPTKTVVPGISICAIEAQPSLRRTVQSDGETAVAVRELDKCEAGSHHDGLELQDREGGIVEGVREEVLVLVTQHANEYSVDCESKSTSQLTDKGDRMHLERFLDRNEQWRLRLKGANGEIVMSSEAYSSTRALNDTLESLAKALGDGAARLPVVTEGGARIESLADWSPRGE